MKTFSKVHFKSIRAFIRKVTISGFITSLIMATGIFSTTYYVSTAGNDSTGTGSLSLPWKTIQKAANSIAPGDIVNIASGTYREQVTINSLSGGSAAGGYKTFTSYNGTVYIKGSDVVKSWVLHSGSIWKKTGWTVNSQQVFQQYVPLQQIGWPDPAFTEYEGTLKKYNEIGEGVGDMFAGSFFYDDAGDTLYVWCRNNADPNTQIMEASVRTRVIACYGQYVKFTGLNMLHNNSLDTAQMLGGVEIGSYNEVSNCIIRYMDFTGIKFALQPVGARIIDCDILDNGCQGFGGTGVGTGTLVRNCVIRGNNYRNFTTTWNAGGSKMAGANDIIIEHSEFTGNNGCAVWFDVGTAMGDKKTVIRNNYIHNNINGSGAIHIEIQEKAEIYNNIIAYNSKRGVYISGSDYCKVYNNTIAYTSERESIGIGGLPRTGYTCSYNEVYNNIIYNSLDIDLFIAKRSDAVGNECNNNLFFSTARSTVVLKILNDDGIVNTYSDLTDWKTATGFDTVSKRESPQFLSQTADQYPLQSTSPCIGAGIFLPEVTVDYALSLRNNPPDIGAYEY